MRRSGLRSMSKKRRREQPIRDQVCEETIWLAGGLCQARRLIPDVECVNFMHDHEGNPIGEVHEVIRRGRRPGAHLDLTLTVYLCAAHHSLVTRNETLGRSVGLAFRSWEVDEARAAVRRLRAGRSMCDGCCDHIDGGSGSRLRRDGSCPCICHQPGAGQLDVGEDPQ